jgi:chromosome segregation ATPase
MKRSIWLVAASILIVVLVSIKTPAQTPPTNDVNVALIRELHDLRIAIEKLAGATSRVQVLTARTSQQEQRISGLMNQLIQIYAKLGESTADMASTNSRLQDIGESLRLTSDPKQREELAMVQRDLTQQLERARLTQASIQAQADAIRQQMTVEQTNLEDLQRKLDELVK